MKTLLFILCLLTSIDFAVAQYNPDACGVTFINGTTNTARIYFQADVGVGFAGPAVRMDIPPGVTVSNSCWPDTAFGVWPNSTWDTAGTISDTTVNYTCVISDVALNGGSPDVYADGTAFQPFQVQTITTEKSLQSPNYYQIFVDGIPYGVVLLGASVFIWMIQRGLRPSIPVDC